MELFEKGYLTETESGMPIRWGDGHALVSLTHMTGMRQGFGNLLAEGSLRLATRYGHPELAMVSKGLDFAATTRAASRAWGWLTPLAHRRLTHARGPRLL